MRVLSSSGGVRGYCFLKSYYYRELLFVRVVCAVIFNYYYYEEFCVSGDVHGSFFITITIASFVVSGGACVYF